MRSVAGAEGQLLYRLYVVHSSHSVCAQHGNIRVSNPTIYNLLFAAGGVALISLQPTLATEAIYSYIKAVARTIPR